MPYWRNLLLVGCLLGVLSYPQTPDAANIQGFPTPTIYQLFGGSYDAFNKYAPLSPLNGLTLGNISHLGASWKKSAYVDRNNAFGVIAFDNMVAINQSYSTGLLLNGLIGGLGWAGAYVDGNLATACASSGIDPVTVSSFGTLTNTVGGIFGYRFVANHDLLVTGIGRFNSGLTPPPGFLSSGVFMALHSVVDNSVYGEALIVLQSNTIGSIVYSCAQTTPGTTNFIRLTKGQVYEVDAYEGQGQGGLLNQTIFYNSNTTVSADTLIGVMGPFVNLGTPIFTSQTNTMYGPYSFQYDMGLLWSNNVVANGGANPSVNTVTNIENFWQGMIADGLETSLVNFSLMATDSVIAASTPIVYYNGNNPWVNHNFVAGDLGVNGLAGDGSTKYLATGIVPSTAGTASNVGMEIMIGVDNSTGTQEDMGCNDGATHSFTLSPHFGGGTSHQFACWSFGAEGTDFLNNWIVPTPAAGFYSGQRTANNAIVVYFANSSNTHAALESGSGTQANAAIATTVNVFSDNVSGSPANFSRKTISFASVNKGLTSALSSKLYNRVNTARLSFGGGSP